MYHASHTHTHTIRSYKELVGCVVSVGDGEFVDADWDKVTEVKTVESVSDFPAGWRTATLYKLHADPNSFCLYFGDEEYEGLDKHYSFINGVLRDGDGDVVELVSSDSVQQTSTDIVDRELVDPELEELEENGGGYLSNDSDENDFIFGGEGDKKLIKM